MHKPCAYIVMFFRNFTKEKVDLIRAPNIYSSYKSYYEKCYSVDVPFIKGIQIRSLKLRIKGSIFRYGIRPTSNEFSVKFHHPNQQLRSTSAQRTWVSKYNISTFYEKIFIWDTLTFFKGGINELNHATIKTMMAMSLKKPQTSLGANSVLQTPWKISPFVTAHLR